MVALVGFPIPFEIEEGFEAPALEKRVMFPLVSDCGMRHFAFAAIVVVSREDENPIRQA